MSERPKKRMVEFIESYWTGGELGSNYQWNDNHGELIRCKDCFHADDFDCPAPLPTGYLCQKGHGSHMGDWFCADGERKECRRSE